MDNNIETLFSNYLYALDIKSDMEFKIKQLEQSLKDAEAVEQSAYNAILQYMQKNGVISDNVVLAGREYCIKKFSGKPSVDVPNVDAIPAEFTRVKITKTPDKIKIKSHLENNKVNWASIKIGDDTISYSLVSVTNEDGSKIKARG